LSQQKSAMQALLLQESVEARLTPFLSDAATLRGVYGHLARAALQLGDLTEGRRLIESYAECKPPPSAMPFVYYHRGEIALRHGEVSEARAAFEQAVSYYIPSLDARRAQARLDEIGG